MSRFRNLMTVAVVVIALAVLGTVPAIAHSMDGSGSNQTSHWSSDEHLLCRPADCSGEVSSGNVVGVWQIVLWAENYLAACGSAGVDGIFGTTTRNATRSLQTYWSLTSDGKVGNQSWGRADNNLVWEDFPNGKELSYDANRSSSTVYFYRPVSGIIYKIAWQSSTTWWNTDHYNRSIDRC